MKKPNVPMNNPITTCRQKVDTDKYKDGWDRIWGKKPMTGEEMAKSDKEKVSDEDL